MPLKDRIKLFIAGSLGCFVLYFLISTKPLYSRLYFFPLWSQSIEKEIEITHSEAPTNTEAKDMNDKGERINNKLHPFLIKGKFGYFDEDGKIAFTQKLTEKITASSSYWCTYKNDCTKAEVYRPDGSKACTINTAGFPYIIDEKIFIFTPGGYGVSEYDERGELLWHYAHTAAITAFNTCKKGTVIGYSDGKLVYLDESGVEVFNLYPGGSAYQVILGVALSPDASFIACVSGLEKQRIMLIKIIDRQYKIVRHEYLKGNLYRRLFVKFDKNNCCALFESQGGIGIIDCHNYDIHFLDSKDEILDVADAKNQNILTILTKNGERCHLIFIEKPFLKIAQTTFLSSDAFLLQEDNKLFLGTVDKISAIEIRH